MMRTEVIDARFSIQPSCVETMRSRRLRTQRSRRFGTAKTIEIAVAHTGIV